MLRSRYSGWSAYVLAVAASVVAAGLRALLFFTMGENFPFLPFVPAVIYSALVGGIGPGLLAVALTAVAATMWLEPIGLPMVIRSTDITGLALYLCICLIIVWLCRRVRPGRDVELAGIEAQARLAAIVESSQDAIVSKSLDGTIRTWNNAAERLYGYAVHEVIGQSIRILIPPERQDEEAMITDRLRHGERVDHYETERIGKDGSRVAVSIAVSPIRDAHGTVIGGSNIARSVAEQRRAQEALKLQSRVLEKMTEGVSLADANGVILYTNPAEDAMFGYAAGELVGQHVTVQNTYAPEENQRIVAQIIEHLKSQGHWTGEFSNRRKDGSAFTTHATITSLELGGKQHWVCVQRDVTEQRRVEVERERLAAMVRASGDAIMSVGPDGRIVTWNLGAERLFGYLAHEIIGQPIAILSPPEQPDHSQQFFERVRQGESITGVETIRLRKDGTHVHVAIAIDPVFDAVGRIIAMVGVLRDISERKRAEAERERLVAMVQASRDGIFGIGLDLVVQTWNRGAEQIFGYRPEEIVGQPAATLVPSDRAQEPHQFFERIRQGERVPEMETARVRKDGSLVHVSVSLDPVFDSEGRVTAAAATVRDITERKRIEVRDRFLLSLDDAVRPLNDPDQITRTYAQLLAEHLDADRCAYADVSEDEDSFNLTGGYTRDPSVPSIVGRYKLSNFGQEVLRLHRMNEPYVVNDVEADERVTPDDLTAYRHTMIRAVVSVPLCKAGRFVAGMALHQWTPRAWRPEDVALIQQVANRCWESIERARVARTLTTSEERYRGLFTAIDQGFCLIEMIYDAQGQPVDYRFIEANPAFERQTGLVDPVGRTALELVPTLERSWVETYGRVAMTGESQRFEQASKPMGRWFDVYAFRAGTPADGRVAILFSDVTQRKQTDAALRASERRFRFLSDIGEMTREQTDPEQVMAIVARELGRHLHVSRCAYADVEEDADRFTIRHDYADGCASTVGDYRLALFGARVAAGLREGQTLVISDVDAELEPADGGDTFNAIAIKAVICCPLVKRGRLTALMAVHQTEPRSWTPEEVGLVEAVVERSWAYVERARATRDREALLQSEQQARAAAERASRMKDEFLATLSHELRTPLNAILGWAGILSRGPTDAEDLRQGLETIERNARAQTQIIEDLLDLSRIISGKLRLDVRRIEMASVVEGAIETVRPAVNAKGIHLKTRFDPTAGSVSGDPGRLQQVFWNLLSNAIKFTPRDGSVDVVLEHLHSHVQVSVIDTGEGIDPNFLPHVFDRFRQADSTSTRQHGGLGIGLSIVKQLVELHGGSVRVSSGGKGSGSTFVVSLPITPGRAEPENTNIAPHRPTAFADPQTAVPDQCADIAGVRVLVVDDEPDARALVKRLLDDCHAEVIAVSNPDEAIVRLKHARFDVLVSDIGMPGEDGYSLIRRVRMLDPTHGGSIPAIALTAYARSEDRMRSVLAGYHMHMAKPVEPAELITMIASLAGRTQRPITRRT